MKKPWYILAYEEKEFLHSKELQKKKFVIKNNNIQDHAHCELCWNRISQLESDSKVGYYEEDSKSWICESCYDSLKDLFKWRIRPL